MRSELPHRNCLSMVWLFGSVGNLSGTGKEDSYRKWSMWSESLHLHWTIVGHTLHEERPGHGVSRGVCMMEECVEEREKGVTKVQHTPHGCLGLLPKYIGLLRLWDTHTHRNTQTVRRYRVTSIHYTWNRWTALDTMKKTYSADPYILKNKTKHSVLVSQHLPGHCGFS